MQPLIEFVQFLKKNHLRELAIENIRLARELDVPLMKLFLHLPENDLINLSIKGLDEFLTSVANNTYYKKQQESLQKWEADQLDGIPRGSVEPTDLIVVYSAQKQTLTKFIPLYTNDTSKAIEIINALENLYVPAQKAAIEALAKMKEASGEKLKQNELLLEQAQSIAHIGSWEWLIPENKIYWSKELYNIFDLKLDAPIDSFENYLLIIYEEDKEYVKKIISSAKETGKPFSFYHRIVRKDLSLRTIHSKGETLFKDNVPVKMLGTAQDITDHLIEEKKFHTLLESAPDAIVLINDKGNIIDWNFKAEKLFDWKKEEVLDLKLSEIIIPHRYREAHERGMKHFLSTGEGPVLNKVLELSALKKDQKEFPIELTISSVQIANKYIFIGFIRDITNRRKTEENLRRIASIVENSDDAIFSKMLDGTIISWNTGAEKTYGYTAEEMIGNGFHSLIPESEKEKFDKISERVSKGEHINHFETERLRKDGVLIYVSLTLSPIKNEMGEIIGTSTIARDITDKKKTEEKMHRLASIVESSDDAIFSKNKFGKILSWNKGSENLYGYSANEILGKSVTMLSPLNRKGEIEELTKKVIDGEHINHFETIRVRKDGKQIFVSLTLSPIKKLTGEIEGVSVVARDITSRKKAEYFQNHLVKTLEKKNKELNDFAYIVSHDLKAPLRAIGSLSNWLASDFGDKLNEEGREHIALLIGRVKRMDSLIDGILRYSRIGRMKEEFVKLDLNDLIHEIIDTIDPPKNIKVKTSGALPEINAGKTSIIQIFQNLIGNAINAMDKPQGEIIVGHSDENSHFKFYVRDNGPGIEEKYFEKIFQIFQSLTARDEHESTGIGLAIVKKIVESYNGKIWVESEVGKGTTFYFTLPRTDVSDPILAEELKV